MVDSDAKVSPGAVLEIPDAPAKVRPRHSGLGPAAKAATKLGEHRPVPFKIFVRRWMQRKEAARLRCALPSHDRACNGVLDERART